MQIFGVVAQHHDYKACNCSQTSLSPKLSYTHFWKIKLGFCKLEIPASNYICCDKGEVHAAMLKNNFRLMKLLKLQF